MELEPGMGFPGTGFWVGWVDHLHWCVAVCVVLCASPLLEATHY